jgi:hypothetical protein
LGREFFHLSLQPIATLLSDLFVCDGGLFVRYGGTGLNRSSVISGTRRRFGSKGPTYQDFFLL